jgi:hypothetical protein
VIVLSKNEEKAAKEIYTVYLAIKNDDHFPNRYDLDNIQKMGAYLSDKDFVWHLKATYPPPLGIRLSMLFVNSSV